MHDRCKTITEFEIWTFLSEFFGRKITDILIFDYLYICSFRMGWTHSIANYGSFFWKWVKLFTFWIGTFLVISGETNTISSNIKRGCIHLLNTRKYCDNTCKYCGNTHEYWPNTWKMCSPASAIFTSIVTILVSFEAILMYFKACGRSSLWNWLLKLILTENRFKIASKLTSIVTILANIALAGDHIFQVLAQYSGVLPQYLWVLSQYSRVLSRWIHPYSLAI